MYTWLKRLFGFDSRAIYRFHDGVRWRVIDPIPATRALFLAKDFSWSDTIDRLQNCGFVPEELNCLRIISNAVREAFEIPPFESGGLTEVECYNLFLMFDVYLGGLKKNGSLMPTSSSAMESESSPEEIWPTKPGSDFGSTSTEKSPDPPTSPVEPTPVA